MYKARSREQQTTSETPPLGFYGYACVAVDSDLHYFGGWCGHVGCDHNSVHKLSTPSLQWTVLIPTTTESRGPMRKSYCGMVAFKDGEEDFLFMVGGMGPTPSSRQPGAQYEQEYGGTLTNEQHIFSLSTSKCMIIIVLLVVVTDDVITSRWVEFTHCHWAISASMF